MGSWDPSHRAPAPTHSAFLSSAPRESPFGLGDGRKKSARAVGQHISDQLTVYANQPPPVTHAELLPEAPPLSPHVAPKTSRVGHAAQHASQPLSRALLTSARNKAMAHILVAPAHPASAPNSPGIAVSAGGPPAPRVQSLNDAPNPLGALPSFAPRLGSSHNRMRPAALLLGDTPSELHATRAASISAPSAPASTQPAPGAGTSPSAAPAASASPSAAGAAAPAASEPPSERARHAARLVAERSPRGTGAPASAPNSPGRSPGAGPCSSARAGPGGRRGGLAAAGDAAAHSDVPEGLSEEDLAAYRRLGEEMADDLVVAPDWSRRLQLQRTKSRPTTPRAAPKPLAADPLRDLAGALGASQAVHAAPTPAPAAPGQGAQRQRPKLLKVSSLPLIDPQASSRGSGRLSASSSLSPHSPQHRSPKPPPLALPQRQSGSGADVLSPSASGAGLRPPHPGYGPGYGSPTAPRSPSPSRFAAQLQQQQQSLQHRASFPSVPGASSRPTTQGAAHQQHQQQRASTGSICATSFGAGGAAAGERHPLASPRHAPPPPYASATAALLTPPGAFKLREAVGQAATQPLTGSLAATIVARGGFRPDQGSAPSTIVAPDGAMFTKVGRLRNPAGGLGGI